MVAITEGERYDVKHKIVRAGGRCIATLPSGDVCGRPINKVYTGERWETKGHWRHNPRPYVNS